jgi:hypothetical protein
MHHNRGTTMNRLSFAKPLVAAAVVVGAFAAASAAHARSDVQVSIGFGVPVYAQPAPVYVHPQPVYVQPRPVYVQPQPVYYGRGHGHGHGHHRHGAWGDADRDGIPNAHDRHYNPGYAYRSGYRDSDRDGVPNRFDRAPGNPYRR